MDMNAPTNNATPPTLNADQRKAHARRLQNLVVTGTTDDIFLEEIARYPGLLESFIAQWQVPHLQGNSGNAYHGCHTRIKAKILPQDIRGVIQFCELDGNAQQYKRVVGTGRQQAVGRPTQHTRPFATEVGVQHETLKQRVDELVNELLTDPATGCMQQRSVTLRLAAAEVGTEEHQWVFSDPVLATIYTAIRWHIAGKQLNTLPLCAGPVASRDAATDFRRGLRPDASASAASGRVTYGSDGGAREDKCAAILNELRELVCPSAQAGGWQSEPTMQRLVSVSDVDNENYKLELEQVLGRAVVGPDRTDAAVYIQQLASLNPDWQGFEDDELIIPCPIHIMSDAAMAQVTGKTQLMGAVLVSGWIPLADTSRINLRREGVPLGYFIWPTTSTEEGDNSTGAVTRAVLEQWNKVLQHVERNKHYYVFLAARTANECPRIIRCCPTVMSMGADNRQAEMNHGLRPNACKNCCASASNKAPATPLAAVHPLADHTQQARQDVRTLFVSAVLFAARLSRPKYCALSQLVEWLKPVCMPWAALLLRAVPAISASMPLSAAVWQQHWVQVQLDCQLQGRPRPIDLLHPVFWIRHPVQVAPVLSVPGHIVEANRDLACPGQLWLKVCAHLRLPWTEDMPSAVNAGNVWGISVGPHPTACIRTGKHRAGPAANYEAWGYRPPEEGNIDAAARAAVLSGQLSPYLLRACDLLHELQEGVIGRLWAAQAKTGTAAGFNGCNRRMLCTPTQYAGSCSLHGFARSNVRGRTSWLTGGKCKAIEHAAAACMSAPILDGMPHKAYAPEMGVQHKQGAAQVTWSAFAGALARVNEGCKMNNAMSLYQLTLLAEEIHWLQILRMLLAPASAAGSIAAHQLLHVPLQKLLFGSADHGNQAGCESAISNLVKRVISGASRQGDTLGSADTQHYQRAAMRLELCRGRLSWDGSQAYRSYVPPTQTDLEELANVVALCAISGYRMAMASRQSQQRHALARATINAALQLSSLHINRQLHDAMVPELLKFLDSQCDGEGCDSLDSSDSTLHIITEIMKCALEQPLDIQMPEVCLPLAHECYPHHRQLTRVVSAAYPNSESVQWTATAPHVNNWHLISEEHMDLVLCPGPPVVTCSRLHAACLEKFGEGTQVYIGSSVRLHHREQIVCGHPAIAPNPQDGDTILRKRHGWMVQFLMNSDCTSATVFPRDTRVGLVLSAVGVSYGYDESQQFLLVRTADWANAQQVPLGSGVWNARARPCEPWDMVLFPISGTTSMFVGAAVDDVDSGGSTPSAQPPVEAAASTQRQQPLPPHHVLVAFDRIVTSVPFLPAWRQQLAMLQHMQPAVPSVNTEDAAEARFDTVQWCTVGEMFQLQEQAGPGAPVAGAFVLQSSPPTAGLEGKCYDPLNTVSIHCATCAM